MSEIYEGGPAFPLPDVFDGDGELYYQGSVGMTMREWYAGRAMSSLVSNRLHEMGPRAIANTAFEIADAMLERSLGNAVESLMASGEAPTLKIISEIVRERDRQINEEGYTHEHDDLHTGGELARAASCYAFYASRPDYPDTAHVPPRPVDWPWTRVSWKPRGRRRDLIRAAALIIAEIDRLDRAERESHAKAKGDTIKESAPNYSDSCPHCGSTVLGVCNWLDTHTSYDNCPRDADGACAWDGPAPKGAVS